MNVSEGCIAWLAKQKAGPQISDNALIHFWITSTVSMYRLSDLRRVDWEWEWLMVAVLPQLWWLIELHFSPSSICASCSNWDISVSRIVSVFATELTSLTFDMVLLEQFMKREWFASSLLSSKMYSSWHNPLKPEQFRPGQRTINY